MSEKNVLPTPEEALRHVAEKRARARLKEVDSEWGEEKLDPDLKARLAAIRERTVELLTDIEMAGLTGSSLPDLEEKVEREGEVWEWLARK